MPLLPSPTKYRLFALEKNCAPNFFEHFYLQGDPSHTHQAHIFPVLKGNLKQNLRFCTDHSTEAPKHTFFLWARYFPNKGVDPTPTSKFSQTCAKFCAKSALLKHVFASF